MPRVSQFFGILILMYYDDHAPPHFHAAYGGREAAIHIRTFQVLRGSLPPRALALVREWARLHRSELESNWERARKGDTLRPILPLK